MSLDEITDEIKILGYKRFNATQIFSWLAKGTLNFDDMTNLSVKLRDKLKDEYKICSTKIIKKLISKDNSTTKYLLSLEDGEKVESVVMKYHHGYTACVSSQAGCRMNCLFCATGKGGFSRNLTASEMISQIQIVEKDMGIKVSNVVMMGMGEPLDNYENTLKFLNITTSEKGMNIGNRHVSVSTCGLANKIYDLAQKKLRLTLSVSLHAPNDEIRNQLLKINKIFPLDYLLSACKTYAINAKRRITFVYSMIKNVNDSDDCAKQLSSKIFSIPCHINLIPLNEIEGSKFEKSQRARIERFCEILTERGISVTIRRSLGRDINASCGQLKFKSLKRSENSNINNCTVVN
jgi:23S rRNA (adenine2503-C2)-methyltransferase